MSYNVDSLSATPAALLSQDERGQFIVRTYTHLLGAIMAFAAIEIWLFQSGMAETILGMMGGVSWLIVLGAFMITGWLATSAAHRVSSPPLQYLGLGAYVLANAIIFVPMLYMAQTVAPGVIESAASVTIAGFMGLTAVAFWTRKDFSFMNGILMWGGIVAIIAIVASVIFGFQLGTWFSVAMIALAGGGILRDTSNILLTFPADRHVAAALSLFGSVAMLFWYVLRLMMSMSRD